MRQISVAVIGLGWWGRIIVALLQGSSKLRAVCGVDTNPAAEAFALQSGLSFRRNFEDVLTDPALDAAEGRSPYPVPQEQMLDNIAALEAIFRSARTGYIENV